MLDRVLRTSTGERSLAEGPAPKRRALRVALHVKVMLSYLVVVGLVVLPTFFYLRTVQRRELWESAQSDLEAQVALLAERLGNTPPEKFNDALDLVLKLHVERVTLIDIEGRILRDSRAVATSMENHRDRPEVREAMDNPGRVSTASRTSHTTGETFIYSAMSFPAAGPPRGVVRLAVPMTALEATEKKSASFVNRTAAVALSVAVLLSLLAAFVVSVPLRRVAEGAQSFAAGDFGHPIPIYSNDELGDAAQALRDLASQLRGRLVSAGADRATLYTLMESLPVGIVLYSPTGTALVLNGSARAFCELGPKDELTRASEILKLPAQAAVIERVLSDGLAQETTLEPPWLSGVRLRARWIALYSAEGERQPALLILDDASLSTKLDETTRLLARCAELLRTAARDVPDRVTAARLTAAAAQAAAAAPPPVPCPSDVRAVRLADLCSDVVTEMELAGAMRDVSIELTLADGDAEVIEAWSRARCAVRSLFDAAVGEPERNKVHIEGQISERGFLLSTRLRKAPPDWDRIAETLQCLGGDAAFRQSDDSSEAWILLPRA